MSKHYKNKVKNQLNKKIKIIRNDWGGEYEALMNYAFKILLPTKLLKTNDECHEQIQEYLIIYE